ncbi:hypothetical protein [Microvirga massiliensis]|uniref:hypothetical protein n=1 Tax=Microvirga massiliensis TaxID=1033741 RepID=UPI00062B8ECB|nr:hypothetical protein [Microvirga massiliensis]
MNALVLAKILFVAEELKVGERYEWEPLIYAMAFKAAVYSVLLAACEILEGLVVGHFRGKTLAESLSEVGGGTRSGFSRRRCSCSSPCSPSSAFGSSARWWASRSSIDVGSW